MFYNQKCVQVYVTLPSYKNMLLWQNGNKPESLLYVAHNVGHSLSATLSQKTFFVPEKKQCECQQPVILDISLVCAFPDSNHN
jgi:hypothetical protein